jgi:DNA-binding NarL/FixJ family response regulator
MLTEFSGCTGKAMAEKIKIYVVDDHQIVRQGLTELIGQEPDMSICGEASDAPSGLQGIAESRPDLVIVDLNLKQGDGLDLIKSIHQAEPKLPVLVLTMYEETYYVERALRAGARGFLTKEDASNNILVAIRTLLRGEMYVCEKVSSKLLTSLLAGQEDDKSPIERLSDRELEVFRCIGEGLGTKQIADKLNLSVKTIETYRANIKEKLDLEGATELVQYAIRWVISREDG